MENRHGLYQEKLLSIFLNYELPEYESSFVYKIIIRLLDDKAAGGEDVSLTEQTRRYLHEAINKLDKSQIAKIYQLIRGMLGCAV